MPERMGLTVPLVRVWMWAVAVGAYSGFSLFKSHPALTSIPDIPVGLDAALTFAMAVLIAFRVRQAYDRWWEARTLWGQLVNVSRNLAVKVRELQRPEPDDRRTICDLIVSFCFGLKDHLRDDANLTALPGFEHEAARPSHLPSYVARKLYGVFHQWRASGKLSDQQMWLLDAEARLLLDICGGCERIKTAPSPVSWRLVTSQCISIYLLVLPWGLVDDFGGWIVPVTVVIAYFVMAAEGIARYVEEPFGVHEDHLDLDGICEVIRRSVSEILLDDAAER